MLEYCAEAPSLPRPLALPYRRPDDPAASSCIADPEEVPPTSGDVERALIRIPKGTVGRRVHPPRHRVRFQDPALGVPNVDHRARTTGIRAGSGHNIAISVEAHTVNTPL